MKATVWHGRRDVRVDEVADPAIKEPTDAIVRVTSTGLCGSDLHLYEPLAPFMTGGDIMGHEPMGIVEEVGPGVTDLRPGDRVVIPFQIACGACFMCAQGLQTQCDATQIREHGMGAALFGYTKLYGQVLGGQAEYLPVPHADYGPIKVPEGPADDRFLYLSDVLPTAWQAVEYAGVGAGDTLVVLGAGPIGNMASRVAVHRGIRTITVDLVAERLTRVANAGAEPVDLDGVMKRDLGDHIREMTGGRGPDAVVDAEGMEAHGSPGMKEIHKLVGLLADAVAEPMMNTAGMDRMAALYSAFDIVRRGGTVSERRVRGDG